VHTLTNTVNDIQDMLDNLNLIAPVAHLDVVCDADDSLSAAVALIDDGNGLLPDPTAGTFAGLVTVEGSTNIALIGLTITNGPDAGIFVSLCSVLELINCAVQGDLEARGSITASHNQQGISLRASSLNSSSNAAIDLDGNDYINENTAVTISNSNFGIFLIDSTISLVQPASALAPAMKPFSFVARRVDGILIAPCRWLISI
jgi:hypothetical protein